MGNTYFKQYINDIDRIIKEAREKHDMASVRLENARQRNDEAKANREYSVEKKAVAAAQYAEEQSEYRKNIKLIQTDTETAFKELRQTLEKHIAEYTAADPGKVDQSAVMLLNSGAMSDTDLAALANKYWNNPTMLKLIKGQADQMMRDSRTARLLSMNIAKYISPRSRLEVFDAAVDIARRTIHENGKAAGVFQKRWDEEFFPGLRDNMAALDGFKMEGI